MQNARVDDGLFPRTFNTLENLYCLLLRTWAFSFELSSFYHSQKGTGLAKLFWVEVYMILEPPLFHIVHALALVVVIGNNVYNDDK